MRNVSLNNFFFVSFNLNSLNYQMKQKKLVNKKYLKRWYIYKSARTV